LTTTRFDVLRIGTYALDEVRLSERIVVVPAFRWSRIQVDDLAAASATAATGSRRARSIA
jgi:hypothetical protein